MEAWNDLSASLSSHGNEATSVRQADSERSLRHDKFLRSPPRLRLMAGQQPVKGAAWLSTTLMHFGCIEERASGVIGALDGNCWHTLCSACRSCKLMQQDCWVVDCVQAEMARITPTQPVHPACERLHYAAHNVHWLGWRASLSPCLRGGTAPHWSS